MLVYYRVDIKGSVIEVRGQKSREIKRNQEKSRKIVRTM